MSDPVQTRTFRFTFGLEHLGLVALARPVIALALIAVITVLAAFGVARLKVDDSLSELFRSDSREFQQYEEIDRRFPSSEFDVLAVIEGDGILTRKGLTAVSDAAIELQLADGIAGFVSMMSARGALNENNYAPPVVPEPLPESEAELAEVIKKLRANEIVKGTFLSDDGTLALMVLSLDRKMVSERGTRPIVAGIREALDGALRDSGLRYKLTGPPVMQLEIRNAVERDRLVYNGLGLLLGLLVAFVFFRKLSLTFLAVAGPAMAILWTLGAIGGLDYRLNLFINVLTPLILVSGFSDSMHLVMAIRRDINRGVDRLTAARNAVRDVAPACLLTAMNAGIALLSFAFAESALVKTFGQAALLAVGISYLCVAVVVPTLAVFVIRKDDGAAANAAVADQPDGAIGGVGRFSVAMVDRISANPFLYLAGGILATVLCGLAYVSLEPQYRLADQVPDREQALDASASLDTKLTGANPVHVMIKWPSKTLGDAGTFEAIAEAHRTLETVAGLGNVWSVESLRRWLAENGSPDTARVKEFIGFLPKHLVRRFIDEGESAVLVTGRLPDIDASEILPIVERIDQALNSVREANPDAEIAVTGLAAIAARNSAKLIGELNWGLVGDMFVIFVFLGIALRSFLAGVASVLPSLFPIFATGTLIWAFGGGLQFASIIAITVAFALAIDSTIHFLNRYMLEEERLAPAGADVGEILRATMAHIGPPVVLTTIVLALGLGVTILSDLPSLRLFGALTAACLSASLVAQFVILPATIAVYRRVWPLAPRGAQEPTDAQPAG